MDAYVSAAVAVFAWIGSLIWAVSSIKSDLRNLTGWVKAVAQKGETTHDKVIALEAKVANLKCRRSEGACTL